MLIFPLGTSESPYNHHCLQVDETFRDIIYWSSNSPSTIGTILSQPISCA